MAEIGLSRQPTPASFVRPTRSSETPRDFVQAVKIKYASEDDSNTGLRSYEEDSIQISGKEVEEVGFDKIRQQLANLKQLQIVLVDSQFIQQSSTRPFEGDADANDAGEACPNVIELDVSRNLFESWSEVTNICRQLPLLKRLRAEGNRFGNIDSNISDIQLRSAPFTQITSLGLDDTLLTWPQIAKICKSFPQLTSLSANGNEYRQLEEIDLPGALAALSLERNEFESFESLEALTGLPALTKLNLKANKIARISNSRNDLIFPSTLEEIDLAQNAISSWTFIDDLGRVFPRLTTLRISQNPLFQSLKNADGIDLTPEDGYMLTMARLGKLIRLNFSTIHPKERLNAEIYYLSQITRALSMSTSDLHDRILSENARYSELCRIYDQPLGEIQSQSSKPTADSRTLAAALIKVTFKLDPSTWGSANETAPWVYRIPKNFSIYAVQSMVGRHFGLPPMKLRLIWETGEEEVVQEELDDESDEDQEAAAKPAIKMREDILAPQTRALATWIEETTANVRVEFNKAALDRAEAFKKTFIQAQSPITA